MQTYDGQIKTVQLIIRLRADRR